MKTHTFTRFRIAHQLLSVLLILGLALALRPPEVAQADAQHGAKQGDALASPLPITLSGLARSPAEADIDGAPAQAAAPLAQAGDYLYTITLSPDTAVVMGEHRAVLPFTVGNVLTGTIDSVQLGLDASIYWINEATSAPPGWQVTQIKNAGGGQAWVQFDVGPSGTPILPGGELTFELIVSGSRFGVFPTANGDATDALNFSYVSVKGGGHTFALSGAAPTWQRRGLSATLSASPSSLRAGGLVTLIMEVTNYSAITQTGIIPSLPAVAVTGTATATLPLGPTPATLALAPGQTRSFTWVYTAGGSGEVAFSASADNTVVYTALEHTGPVYIGNLTAVLELEDTQVISGQLATVNIRVQNNDASAVLDVAPSALSALGTATAALASGPEPPIVPYLDAGATASFRWEYTIAGNVGATYAFSGTASEAGGTSSNVATSAQGEVARYLATIAPRYAVIGTTNQILVFEVTNGGGEAVSAIDFTIPSGFAHCWECQRRLWR